MFLDYNESDKIINLPNGMDIKIEYWLDKDKEGDYGKSNCRFRRTILYDKKAMLFRK